MSRYLVGPDGLRVEPVQLTRGTAHWIFAQMVDPGARPGEIWYFVTRNGRPLGFPGYYQQHQLEEIVDLADLREPEEGADTGIA